MWQQSTNKVPPSEDGYTTINGENVGYIIKRTSRARYVRLEVKHDSGLTIIVPARFDIKKIPEIIKSKQRWIARRLVDLQRLKSRPVKNELIEGDSIPFRGVKVPIAVSPDDVFYGTVKFNGSSIMTSPGKSPLDLTLRIYKWYRDQADSIIQKRVKELADLIGVTYNRISTRRARTRWGSCSPKRNLNFNWKLITLPPAVADYVFIHELCHLKEMNHSRKFWQTVSVYCPEWREHKKWLREYESELAKYLPSWFG